MSGSGVSGTNGGGGAGGSLTPAEAAKETKKEIVATLRAGSFNEAFQMALSARNLELVVMTCEMVNPTQIFSQVGIFIFCISKVGVWCIKDKLEDIYPLACP